MKEIFYFIRHVVTTTAVWIAVILIAAATALVLVGIPAYAVWHLTQ